MARRTLSILSPSPDVGGHCIAVDPWFIVHGAPEQTPLIRTARGVNDAKIHHAIARASALVEANPQARVACLGLAFKANIDDFRESPARLVAATLRAASAAASAWSRLTPTSCRSNSPIRAPS